MTHQLQSNAIPPTTPCYRAVLLSVKYICFIRWLIDACEFYRLNRYFIPSSSDSRDSRCRSSSTRNTNDNYDDDDDDHSIWNTKMSFDCTPISNNIQFIGNHEMRPLPEQYGIRFSDHTMGVVGILRSSMLSIIHCDAQWIWLHNMLKRLWFLLWFAQCTYLRESTVFLLHRSMRKRILQFDVILQILPSYCGSSKNGKQFLPNNVPEKIWCSLYQYNIVNNNQ